MEPDESADWSRPTPVTTFPYSGWHWTLGGIGQEAARPGAPAIRGGGAGGGGDIIVEAIPQ